MVSFKEDKICRTCVCIPKDDVPDAFFALVHGNCQYGVYVKLLLATDNSNHCLGCDKSVEISSDSNSHDNAGYTNSCMHAYFYTH